METGSSVRGGHLKSKICRLIIGAILTVITMNVLIPAQAQTLAPTAKKGELAAPNWSFFDNPPLEINGEWEVIWGQLVPPEEFSREYRNQYFKLPGRWNHVKTPNMDGAMGVATFRSHLKLPSYNRDVAYHFIAPHAAYRVYINGVMVVSNGTVSETLAGFEPSYVSGTFQASSGDSEVVLQMIADYNTVGTITSYNVGGVITPFEGFKLRGQYSRSQRAPTLTDLFSVRRTDSDTIAGPCNDLREDGTGIQELEGTGGAEAGTSILATVTANCLATPGIQAYFADPANRNLDGSIDPFDDDGSIRGPNSGNPDVDVETADTFTFGAVFQPPQIDGLTIIADYFRIEIADVISSISSQDQIDLCYASTDFPNSPFCTPITRSPINGQVTEIVNAVQNLNEELVEGIDVAIEYEWEFGFLPGEFDVDLRYSHYFTEDTKFNGLNGELTRTFLGEIQNPDNEFRARFGYTAGDIRLSYRLSYEQGGVDDINNNPLPTDNQYFRVEDQFYHSIYARYEFGNDDQYRIYGGVNNIADNLGPLIPSGTSNGSSLNIVSDLARPVGREFYIGARIRF